MLGTINIMTQAVQLASSHQDLIILTKPLQQLMNKDPEMHKLLTSAQENFDDAIKKTIKAMKFIEEKKVNPKNSRIKIASEAVQQANNAWDAAHTAYETLKTTATKRKIKFGNTIDRIINIINESKKELNESFN